MTSASNERQIRARTDQARRDRLTDKIVIETLMSLPDGRRWVWLRLAEAGIFQSSEDLDHARLCFAQGVRNGGLRLLKDVTTFTPRQYIIMTEEATSVQLEEAPNVGSTDDASY